MTLNIHAILHRQMIGLASNWYPDWGHSETCRNDGAEPVYMVDSLSYITRTKEECCAKVRILLQISGQENAFHGTKIQDLSHCFNFP